MNHSEKVKKLGNNIILILRITTIITITNHIDEDNIWNIYLYNKSLGINIVCQMSEIIIHLVRNVEILDYP